LAVIAILPRRVEPAAVSAANSTTEGGGRRGSPVFGVVLAILAATLLLPWLWGRWLSGLPAGENLAFTVCVTILALALLRASRRPPLFAAALVIFALASEWTEPWLAGAARVERLRNFYGVYKVYDRDGLRYLQHGTTQHGRQYLNGPHRDVPLAYYHPSTPAGELLAARPALFPRIAMIGLGTGALVAYAGERQWVAILELDPDNLPVARRHFGYLDAAEARGARLELVFGDGRLSLRRRPAGALDLVIVDAFNSGAIPVHLLTVESLGEYMRAIQPNGLLLMHVSNKLLDLVPVVAANARTAGLAAFEKSNATDRHPDAEFTQWMAVTRPDAPWARILPGERGWRECRPGPDAPRPWTDQCSNLLGALLGF
jgi:hypothetical protein